ncbi:MAG: sigma-70 family RNA polymerase sigma factor [Butyricicoccus pullicaecorum]|nr:sigma-70 family RNA polymerase sigma factor [Butyricicoccus pullicaecorum]
MTGEKVLIARAKKGEIAAFESLMTAYENRVYTLALRSTGSEQDAADITQEVFLRAWKSLDSFRGDSSLSTWLYRVTSNLCVDFARKRAAEGNMASIDDTESPAASIPDLSRAIQPEQAAENQELREELQYALAQLSEEHRRVVLLRDVAGLTYTEIARTLELEEGTVKSRLARARNSLRKILLERGNISLPTSSKQAEGRRADHE